MYKEYKDAEAQRFLEDLGSKLDADSRIRFQEGQLVLDAGYIYFKKEITGMGGSNPLIEESDSIKIGTRNINNAELPKLENLVLKKIILRHATDAAEVDSALLKYSTKEPATFVPALQNGELLIEQDGELIARVPVNRFFNAADLDEVSKEGWELPNWRLIKAGLPISVKLECASGQSVSGSEKHHLEVILAGTKTRKR